MQLSDHQFLRDTAIGRRHKSAVTFRKVIPVKDMLIIVRDITGPVGMGQRFGTDKAGPAADRNLLFHATNNTVLSSYCRSLEIETNHVTDTMEQSFLRS